MLRTTALSLLLAGSASGYTLSRGTSAVSLRPALSKPAQFAPLVRMAEAAPAEAAVEARYGFRDEEVSLEMRDIKIAARSAPAVLPPSRARAQRQQEAHCSGPVQHHLIYLSLSIYL